MCGEGVVVEGGEERGGGGLRCFRSQRSVIILCKQVILCFELGQVDVEVVWSGDFVVLE